MKENKGDLFTSFISSCTQLLVGISMMEPTGLLSFATALVYLASLMIAYLSSGDLDKTYKKSGVDSNLHTSYLGSVRYNSIHGR